MATTSRPLTGDELTALAAVLQVQAVAAMSDLKRFGHLTVDPQQGEPYRRMIDELVRRKVLAPSIVDTIPEEDDLGLSPR